MSGRRRRLISASLISALAVSTTALAQAATDDIDIPASSLQAALKTFERQTRLEILYNPKIVMGRQAPAVRGRLTPDEALHRLIGEGEIDVIWSGPNTVSLRRHAPGHSEPDDDARPADPPRPDQAPRAAIPPRPAEAQAGTTAVSVEEIVVTGTHIRGIQANASPVVEVRRSEPCRATPR